MLPFANYYISSPSMSENNTSNNRRRKKKRPMTVYGGGGDDNLAVVKAAAWAWYQRKEGKPIMREFDLTRAPRTPRPSRYKIEATKNMILSENKVLAEHRVSKSSLWYANYPLRGDQETQYSRLLDTYEIKNISKRLNIDDSSLSVSSSSVFRLKDDNHHNHIHNHDYDCHDHGLLQKKIGYENNTTSTSSRNKSDNGFKKVSKRNLWKGMIVMGPGSKVCGRSNDVDLRASQASRRTVKVAAAAEALFRSAAGGKKSGRR
ncbi:hypothetical protein EUTSA_v10019019mg [Eutrema salsugineum]|uniref:Uncharacterized protein n=1 Tax=Eutrema salsugineum TaxID=72664 RepID=V4KMW5_EUTSA|nr:uncharacterized protein LOC18007909 [Eutrema salsugineum]ESQ28643.1 hypothetical protein EUTSA_v10019019mg [Eutrema salsugineum]